MTSLYFYAYNSLLENIWFAPSSISFSRPQMLFLLQHLDLLGHGYYPPECADTGYTTAPGIQQSHSQHAPFETPIQLHAEITYRLERTGIDGKLLVAEIKAGSDFIGLSPESKRALNYCSGYKRRIMDYHSWCRSRRFRSKRYTKPSSLSLLTGY